jgi:hypothetical protein
LGTPEFIIARALSVLKNKPLIMFDFEPLEKSKVFITESSVRVMLFLVLDVTNYARDLRVAIGEGAEPLLP